MTDLEIINKIEHIVGTKIPFLEQVDGNANGYHLHSNNVTKLSIIDSRRPVLELISKLKDLTVMYLRGNSIFDLRPICNLEKLSELDLSNNLISDLSPIIKLKNLRVLKLNLNLIDSIEFLEDLNGLRTLQLSGNRIVNIDPLENLSLLEQLAMGGNLITNIKPLQKIHNLKELYLQGNLINNIFCLQNNKGLEIINLCGNKIESIEFLAKLTNLHTLDVSKNRITSIPPKISELGVSYIWENNFKMGYINLFNNPIQNPPIEIVKLGNEAIKQWYEGGEKVPVNEVKVLLVGHGEVGKTSLVKCLKGEKADTKEAATHQISISENEVTYKRKKIKLKYWDFGGQEVMHSTHQFFLSKRSVYILVLDGRRDEDAEYWLKHIDGFGDGSPVLVVLNKIDTNHSYDVNRQFLKEKYPFIIDFYKTNCLTNEGLNEVKKGIITALSKVEILNDTWPETWVKVKDSLESNKQNYISQIEYETLCDNEGVRPEAKKNLALFLNDIGVAVYFKELALAHLHILQPRWASAAAYRIITSKTVADNKGLLDPECMGELMAKRNKEDFEYPANTHTYIIELLQKFELCYKIQDRKEYLIPELLSIQQPGLPKHTGDVLRFYFQYDDLLPRSIIPRFIVRLNEDILDNLQWRTGVVLKDKLSDAVAIIISDAKERKISVSISGKRRREYFAIIRKTFHSLHNTFEKLEVSEWIPLTETHKGEPLALEYEELLGYEEEEIEDYFLGKIKKTYKVKDLLNGIEDEKLRKGEFEWDVFICHSSLDKPIIQDIISDLTKNKISYWFDDEQIQPSDNYHIKIEDGLLRSRIIMPCISVNQLKSGWARNEYQTILNRVISGKTEQRVLPFVLDNTPDDKIPLFLSNYRRERYQDTHEYKRLLEYLSRKGR